MTNPKITVITPVYNGAAFIRRAFASVENQRYDNLEYIVIDGASTDGTPAILAEYAHLLTRFVSEPDNGSGDALNKGLRLATGDWIVLLAADDELLPGTFARLAETSAAHPDIDIICVGAETFHASDGVRQTYNDPKKLALTLENMLFEPTLINAHYIKREIYQRFGFFAQSFPGHRFYISNDREYMIKLALADLRYLVIAEVLYRYHDHSGSLTFGLANTLAILEEHADIAQNLLPQPLDSPQRQLVLRWQAHEAVIHCYHLLTARRWLQALRLLAASLFRQPINAWRESIALMCSAVRKRL